MAHLHSPTHTSSSATPLATFFRRMVILLLLVAALFVIYAWYDVKNEELGNLARLSDLAARSADQFFDHYASSERLLGDELLTLDALHHPNRGWAALLRFREINPELALVSLVQPDGQIVVSTLAEPGHRLPNLSRTSVANEFDQTVSGTGLHVARPHATILNGQWVIPLYYPVRDDGDNVVFVVAAGLPLENQQAIWRQLSFPAAINIGLLRQDGYLDSLWPPQSTYSRTYSQPVSCTALGSVLMNGRIMSGHFEGGMSEQCGSGFRIGSYDRLSRYPLTAFVDVPRTVLVDLWAERIKIPLSLFTLFTVGISGLYRLARRLHNVLERRRALAEKKLIEIGHRNELILGSAGDAIYGTDIEGRVVFVNPAAAHMLGYEAIELIGHNMHRMVHYKHADGSPYRQQDCPFFRALHAGVALQASDEVFWTKTGKSIPIEYVSTPIKEGEAVTGAVILVKDISARKRDEAWLTGEKRVLEMIAQSEPLDNTLNTIARLVEEGSTNALCCAILFLAPDEDHLRVGAGPSVPPTLHERFDGLAIEAAPIVAAAIRRRQPVMVTDIAHEPDALPLREYFLAAGFRACWCNPIMLSDQELLGIFLVYYREARALNREEIGIVDRATQLTEIAIKKTRVEERLGFLAHRDPLTGLPNRALLHDRLQHALVLAGRHQRFLAVLYVDLDRFKHVNDTLGHDAGDELLNGVARRLRGAVRSIDTVARQGGDEFLVVLEEVAKERDVSDVAQKILQSLSEPIVISGREIFITTSIGVSLFPRDGRDPVTLIKNADTAMYRSKERGRNQVQFFTEEMNLSLTERFELTNELRRALRKNEFKLYYQPKVDLRDGHIAGMEALLRWTHPRQGLILPSRFVPLLEDSGLIIPVGEWVMRTACAQNRAWQGLGVTVSRMAVNISELQFRHGQIVQTVSRILKETGLDPRYLELELTESVIMQESQATVTELRALKDMGIAISIDDFGTGYSSLSYLKRFPVDSIKIDQSFIRDIPNSVEDAAIANAIIAMAHSLNLRVIAEGVETADQLRYLRRRDCDEIQGHLVALPLPADQFERFLRQHPVMPLPYVAPSRAT